MYRDDFIEDVRSFSELISFAEDIGCTACDDLADGYTYSDWIDENIVSWARENSWRDLLTMLSNFDDNSGYDYYVWDDYESEYRPANDDDFDYYKSQVLEYADDYNEWEDNDEEEEEDSTQEPEPVDPEDIDPTPEEDYSLGDMLVAGVNCIRAIDQEALETARQQEKAYAAFINDAFNM